MWACGCDIVRDARPGHEWVGNKGQPWVQVPDCARGYSVGSDSDELCVGGSRTGTTPGSVDPAAVALVARDGGEVPPSGLRRRRR